MFKLKKAILLLCVLTLLIGVTGCSSSSVASTSLIKDVVKDVAKDEAKEKAYQSYMG